MDNQIAQRIAKALENTVDDSLVPYRSGLQAKDFTDSNSISSIPFYPCYEARNLAVSLRFSQPTAVATVYLIRGYISPTNIGTFGDFTAQTKETYVFTAPSSGTYTNSGYFVPDQVLFSALASRAVKVTLASSCSTGTVDIYLRRVS